MVKRKRLDLHDKKYIKLFGYKMFKQNLSII